MMTAAALEAIGKLNGPRCCKRNSYTAIIEAAAFVKERFGVEMQLDPSRIKCTRSLQNNQCKKKDCPFYE